MNKNTSWPNKKKISVIVDPPGWFTSYAEDIVTKLRESGHDARLVDRQAEAIKGDIAFYLSCTGLTPAEGLARNDWNIVVHASDLPQGRGFSPLVWQVLEGRNDIPLSMILMADAADAGDILMQRSIAFSGHELNDEMRDTMGRAISEMCVDLANSHEPPKLRAQEGIPSWYPRRKSEDSQLDPHRTIAEQFALLRVVDNDRYPAFFDLHGQRYTLKIERTGAIGGSDAQD